MYIKHHFTSEEARQFCGEYGIDWHWSRSIDERDPTALELRKTNRNFPRAKVNGVGLSSWATAQPVSSFNRKHP